MATDTPKRAGRGLRIALFLSLALNLLVVGVIAGGVASGRIGGDKPSRVGLDLGPVARILEPEDRRQISRNLRDTSGLRPPSLRQRRAELAEMAELLREDPFDRAAMEALLTRQRQSADQFITAAQGALVDHFEGLPASQRAAYADRLDAEIEQMRGRPGGPRQSGDGKRGD